MSNKVPMPTFGGEGLASQDMVPKSMFDSAATALQFCLNEMERHEHETKNCQERNRELTEELASLQEKMLGLIPRGDYSQLNEELGNRTLENKRLKAEVDVLNRKLKAKDEELALAIENSSMNKVAEFEFNALSIHAVPPATGPLEIDANFSCTGAFTEIGAHPIGSEAQQMISEHIEQHLSAQNTIDSLLKQVAYLERCLEDRVHKIELQQATSEIVKGLHSVHQLEQQVAQLKAETPLAEMIDSQYKRLSEMVPKTDLIAAFAEVKSCYQKIHELESQIRLADVIPREDFKTVLDEVANCHIRIRQLETELIHAQEAWLELRTQLDQAPKARADAALDEVVISFQRIQQLESQVVTYKANEAILKSQLERAIAASRKCEDDLVARDNELACAKEDIERLGIELSTLQQCVATIDFFSETARY